MNKTRPLFLACFLLLTGLFAFNSYADEVTIEYQGGIYTGEVVGDVPNGKGTWVLPDKTKYVGEFKDGKPWNGTEHDKDGKITATYSEGASVLTTEQEIKELLELRKLIKAKFEELLHPKVEGKDVDEDLFLFAGTLEELIELEREMDTRIEELQQR